VKARRVSPPAVSISRNVHPTHARIDKLGGRGAIGQPTCLFAGSAPKGRSAVAPHVEAHVPGGAPPRRTQRRPASTPTPCPPIPTPTARLTPPRSPTGCGGPPSLATSWEGGLDPSPLLVFSFPTLHAFLLPTCTHLTSSSLVPNVSSLHPATNHATPKI